MTCAPLEVRIQGRVWRVYDKAVAADSVRVVVVRLDPQQLVVELPFEPDDQQAMKLELQIEGQRLGDLYGTVAGPHVEHPEGTLIRLTSVPADVRCTLDAWLQEHTDDVRL